MLASAFENKKIAAIFIEEGKSITGLFGGFSLALLIAPISNPASALEMASIFISSISSLLLVALAYVLTIASGFFRAKKYVSDPNTSKCPDITPRDLSAIGFLVIASILILLLNIILVCFRVHWAAGLGAITGIFVFYCTGKYLDRPPR